MTHTTASEIGIWQGAISAALSVAAVAMWLWWTSRNSDDDEGPPPPAAAAPIRSTFGFHEPKGATP